MLATFTIIGCALLIEANLVLGIFNGESARIEDYPYQASIEYKGRGHITGASIISKHYVLTVAHYTYFATNTSQLFVRVGSSFRGEGGRLHKVTQFISHEGYDDDKYDGYPVNDIAIVKVKEPFQYDDTCRPIKLFEAHEEATPGAKAVVTGYGYMKNYEEAKQLQVVVLDIVSKETCEKAHEVLPENAICASRANGKGPCTGDSGGPLAIGGRLAGIIAWGVPCTDPVERPTGYTEIARYRDWIKQRVEFD